MTPATVAEVDFAELTADGHIRHGSYLGSSEGQGGEGGHAGGAAERHRRDGSRQGDGGRYRDQHAGRLIFPGTDDTKIDVARYYDGARRRLLAIAGKRPLSLLRLPEGLDGESFFQKHAGQGFPRALHRIEITDERRRNASLIDATRPRLRCGGTDGDDRGPHLGRTDGPAGPSGPAGLRPRPRRRSGLVRCSPAAVDLRDLLRNWTLPRCPW